MKYCDSPVLPRCPPSPPPLRLLLRCSMWRCRYQTGLSSLVLRKKRPLIEAFTQLDKEGSGYVTKDLWCKVMENVSAVGSCNLSFWTVRQEVDHESAEHFIAVSG